MFPRIVHTYEDDEFWISEGCHILEIMNSDDDPLVSVARARLGKRSTTAWHYLRTCVERYLILEGRGMVEVGDLGARAVGPGDAVCIPAGCRQRITCLGDNELVFLCICTPRFEPEEYVTVG